MDNAQILSQIQMLPRAEHFLFRAHARKRATIIGGTLVPRPCPATGKWTVASTPQHAAQYADTYGALRHYLKGPIR